MLSHCWCHGWTCDKYACIHAPAQKTGSCKLWEHCRCFEQAGKKGRLDFAILLPAGDLCYQHQLHHIVIKIYACSLVRRLKMAMHSTLVAHWHTHSPPIAVRLNVHKGREADHPLVLQVQHVLFSTSQLEWFICIVGCSGFRERSPCVGEHREWFWTGTPKGKAGGSCLPWIRRTESQSAA